MNTTATPIKSISHPLWGLSLAVLLANDHALKGAGIVPSWVTGKLSDLAGYFLFPTLLATVLRVRSRRGLLLCHLLTVGLLLLTELSPAFCEWLLAVSGHRLWPDPTDLVALVSIGLSWRILVPLALRPESPRVVGDRRRKVMVMLGAVATVATSPRPPRDGQLVQNWDQSTEVFIENNRGQSLQVRLSAPREDIEYDCEAALSRPQELFSATQFSVVRHVTLSNGDTLPLSGFNLKQRAGCNVIWIAAEGSPEFLAVWRSGSFASGNNPTTAGGHTRILDGTLEGTEGLLTPAPSTEPSPISPQCEASSPDSLPAWSSTLPASGPHTLRQILRGSDGCDVLVLAQGSAESRFTLCSEPVVFPFAVGDSLRFSLAADASDGLVVSGQSAGKTVSLSLVRHATGLPSTRMSPPCPVARATCGAGEAVRVQVPTTLGISRALARGEQETYSMGSQSVTVHVRRAEQVLLNDLRCDATATLDVAASYITLSTY